MRLLSRAARIILIQVVTSATPLYVMQYCKLPARDIEELERCNWNFFWGIQIRGNPSIWWSRLQFIDQKQTVA